MSLLDRLKGGSEQPEQTGQKQGQQTPKPKIEQGQSGESEIKDAIRGLRIFLENHLENLKAKYLKI
jgi:hypothetical protein